MDIHEIPTTETPLAWKELLSDTTIVVDGIEEGPLCELSEEMETFKGTNETPLSRSDWKELVNDRGDSVTEGINGRKFGQSYFSDNVQTRKQRDWTQFLSTSHLVEGKRSSNMTHLKTDEDLKRHQVSPNNFIDMAVRQKIVPDVGDQKTPMHPGRPVTLPQPSDVIMKTSSVPLSQTSGNLPARPLTIGDSMTIGNSLGYRPVNLFTPDGNPPQTASSTPVIPTLPPSMLQHSEDTLDAEIDVPGDMSARERLQPLGRDGLEVKQGPPWGVTIPLFQPHSRKSSFSSIDSDSSHGSTSHLQPQTTSVQTIKVDTESSLAVVSTEGSLSQRSSLRSLESKEPMAAKILSPNEYLNTSVGKFHALKPMDVDSPVSKILGPTFKTTQKMLEELQRRPLAVYNDTVEQQPREEDLLTKENEGFSHSKERIVDRSFIVDSTSQYVDLPENKHTASHSSRTSDFFEMKLNQSTKSDNSNQLSSTDLILRSTSSFPSENKVDHSFNKSSQIGESQKLTEGDQQKISLFNKTETPKTSALTDNTLISENVHSSNHVINDVTQLRSKRTAEHINVGGQESLSWDNVLEVHSTSGEMSEFDRIASESISLSNAVANRFREELKSVELIDIESDDEGILDDERINTLDSGVSESTTNDEIFHPKGLVPLSNQGAPGVGIYDVRMSSGPGSSNRKRLALGKLPREISQSPRHGGIYVSEGTTGTEVEDRGVESHPEGQSTPKSDDVAWIRNIDDDDELADLDSLPATMLRDVNISRKSCNFMNVQPSAAVEHTWSISKPVMSQLDPKRTPLVNSEAKQKAKQRMRHENESVYSSERERKRILRHREHSKKTSKTVKQHSHFSESSEYSPRDTNGETKKSLADMILENFRREEKEQERRMKKLEELKQNQTASDLNALWQRFQELVSKKDSQSRNSRQRSRSSQRSTPFSTPSSTPSSNLSVASSSDIPFTEDKPRDHTVNLSTDSNNEFEQFLKRVREIPSSDTVSVASRDSSNNHRRRQHDHQSTPIALINRKPHPKVTVLSSIDLTTSTNEKPSEPETTLSLPMWLGVNTKHPKKKTKSAKKTNEAIEQKESVKRGSTVCTCGGKVKKITTKTSNVRDVGVNCPTPPVVSNPVLSNPVLSNPVLSNPVLSNPFLSNPVVSNPVVSNEMNTVDVGALRINTLIEAPPSLVKLTLQDAFMYSKQYFIKRSRERIRNIRENRKEAGDVVVIPTDKMKSKRENVNKEEAKIGTSKPLKLYEELQKRKPRQMTQKEIRNVNKRMYKNLPEVKRKNDDQRRVDFYKTNRLRAKLYGKHVRNNLNRMYTAA